MSSNKIGKYCIHCKTLFFSYPSDKRIYCSRTCFDSYRKRHAKKTYQCPICGSHFFSKKKKRVYCSNACKIESFKGKSKTLESRAKIRATKIKNGTAHSGPFYTNKQGFVKITGTNKNLHTAIAENVLGRPLKPNETVHHIDENRLNNRNNNLLICERSLHPTIHARMRAAR